MFIAAAYGHEYLQAVNSVWLPLMGPTPPPWSVLQRPRPMNLFLCGNEGVQMHGGIGMTDEHEIGFFVKRRRVA
jgi:hypothetical protein